MLKIGVVDENKLLSYKLDLLHLLTKLESKTNGKRSCRDFSVLLLFIRDKSFFLPSEIKKLLKVNIVVKTKVIGYK